MSIIIPDFHSINSLRREVQPYVSLLTQISKSLKEKFSDLLLDTKRNKRGIIDGIATIFKAINKLRKLRRIRRGIFDEYYANGINELN